MLPLIYFIVGIIFIQIIMPILGSFTDLLLTLIEVKKLELSLKGQKTSQELTYGEMPPAHQIGFSINSQEEDEYDEDD